MSKLKAPFTGHTKTKFRHSLRRKETVNKKLSRMNANSYSYGWFVKDSRRIGERVTVTKPAHTVPNYIEETVFVNARPWLDEEAHTERRIRRNGYIEIPEKTRTVRRYAKSVTIKPYLKKCNDSTLKKYLKKRAAKKTRQNKNFDMPAKRSDFKKEYDLWWYLY